MLPFLACRRARPVDAPDPNMSSVLTQRINHIMPILTNMNMHPYLK